MISTHSKQPIFTKFSNVRELFFDDEQLYGFFNAQLLVIERQDVGKNSTTNEVNIFSGKFKSKLSAQIMRILAIRFDGKFA
ncbi:hypothetical protein [Brumicola pallidula]|jgi:hypothetical protein|uniref:Uncharacterized protein n=1 Tax=Brumicola pallidula DSM 14239 = ACAM 615 TaxID=1121922 RepID=K6Y2G5_9ALTE|nr:hypothetical protein [Glaciecola pallidula]GAC27024.1 hypothetical protein GPAL_0143 [Glaciecola pallidula DSM 14239 = ACAM 615]